jgi:hypothetical protein
VVRKAISCLSHGGRVVTGNIFCKKHLAYCNVRILVAFSIPLPARVLTFTMYQIGSCN